MDNLICFLPVSVEKELPKEAGYYHVITDNDITKDTYHFNGISFDSSTTHFLREFSLPELMEEAIRAYWKRRLNEDGPILSEKEFINDFLKQKGIL